MTIDAFFAAHPSVAVAVSGGVDSAALLGLAKAHAKRTKAYFVRTAFQPSQEEQDARATAEALGVSLQILHVDVLADKTITANPQNRCYYCKQKIFAAIKAAAQADGFDTVLDGTNADDDAFDRPGMQALREMGILSPLRLCGITKAQVRRIAASYGLTVSDKPSYACLATRIPTGTAITQAMLQKTEQAETALAECGFSDFRVRYANGGARLELCRHDFALLAEKQNEVKEILLTHYTDAWVDLNERKSDG